MDNGIRNVVGDNTRDILRNQQNKFWPAISNRAVNGYAGLVIIPRWATTIYYNCDLPSSTRLVALEIIKLCLTMLAKQTQNGYWDFTGIRKSTLAKEHNYITNDE